MVCTQPFTTPDLNIGKTKFIMFFRRKINSYLAKFEKTASFHKHLAFLARIFNPHIGSYTDLDLTWFPVNSMWRFTNQAK